MRTCITDPIREVVADGIVTADGTHRRYDTILLGTGFKVWGQASADRVVGRDGRTLREVWQPTGPVAYRGTVIAGFPNHFLIIGPNTGLGNNSMINIIEAQVEYVIDALERWSARASPAWTCGPRPRSATTSEIQERMVGTVWTGGGCKSWYLTEDGVNRTLWPSYSNEFKRSLERFEPADYSTVVLPERPAHLVDR